MERRETEIAVIGGGAAGLATFDRLRKAGRAALLVEARERLGGRVFTLHPPNWPLAVELGAEFIHGSPPDLIAEMNAAGCRIESLPAYSERRNWTWHNGELVPANDFGGGADTLFDRLETFDTAAGDISFSQFLNAVATGASPEARTAAVHYVEGFDAADSDRISVRSLQREHEAEATLGWKQHRLAAGYDAMLQLFDLSEGVQTNTTVLQVGWRKHGVRIEARHGDEAVEILARRAVVTLPLGVMQAGAVAFDPPLGGKIAAMRGLAMGSARRAVIRLCSPIWESLRDSRGNSLQALHFLFSGATPDGHFPTWWTGGRAANGAAQMVGWAASRHARAMRGWSDDAVRTRALEDLATRWRISPAELEAAVAGFDTFDWQSDPLAQGAYSYVVAGGMDAQAELARPVDDTLFFAGEATETHGHHATVYGAIRSGRRAAEEILRSV